MAVFLGEFARQVSQNARWLTFVFLLCGEVKANYGGQAVMTMLMERL